MVIAKAIRLSLDRGMKEREMCARLMERLAFGVCCVKGGPEEEKEETRTRSHSTSSSSSARVTRRQNHEEEASASSNFYFPPEAFENAFDYLLSMLADVEIDVPKAMEDVSRFFSARGDRRRRFGDVFRGVFVETVGDFHARVRVREEREGVVGATRGGCGCSVGVGRRGVVREQSGRFERTRETVDERVLSIVGLQGVFEKFESVECAVLPSRVCV